MYHCFNAQVYTVREYNNVSNSVKYRDYVFRDIIKLLETKKKLMQPIKLPLNKM